MLEEVHALREHELLPERATSPRNVRALSDAPMPEMEMGIGEEEANPEDLTTEDLVGVLRDEQARSEELLWEIKMVRSCWNDVPRARTDHALYMWVLLLAVCKHTTRTAHSSHPLFSP